MEKTPVVDSGGAGMHRGGLGVRTRLRELHDDDLPTLFSIYPEGAGIATDGLFGGHPGGGVRGVVLDRTGNVVHDCGAGELVTLTATERMVEVCLAEGSGFGDPRERAHSGVEDDVASGNIPRDAATNVYGYPASASAAE